MGKVTSGIGIRIFISPRILKFFLLVLDNLFINFHFTTFARHISVSSIGSSVSLSIPKSEQ